MALENYLTYTEVDPGGDFAVSDHTITVTTLIRNIESHIQKNKGVDHFGDFEHLVDVKITFSDQRALCIGWGVSNGSNTFQEMRDNDDGIAIWLYRTSTGVYRIYLEDTENSNQGIYDCALNTDYYLTIKREGATCTVDIYSNPSRTVLLDTLSIVCNETSYQYIIAAGSFENATSPYENRAFSCLISNLDLQAIPPMGFGFEMGIRGGMGKPPLETGGASIGG